MNKKYLFVNGEVITANHSNQVVEALAIRGEEIIMVGSNKQIKDLQDGNSKVIDLQNKTLIPGFIDSHLHISMYGTNCLSISCKNSNIKSIDDVLLKIKNEVNKTPKGKWIRAWGFNEDNIVENRFPTKEELNAITTDHPVIISRACGHMSVVNSHALKIANINKNTPDPNGGKIDRNKDGEPSGLLIENAHMKMFNIAAFTEEELSEAHSIASQHFAEKGITSIHDATGYGLNNLRALQKDSHNGIIKQRVYAMVGALNESENVVNYMVNSGVFTGLGDDKFKIGPVKLFLDGSSSGPTVWTREPYTSNPDNFGIHYFSQDEVDELFIPAHRRGWQITAHAQGDAAIDMILTTIEKARKIYPWINTRHRIEHAGITSPKLIERMKEQDVVPIPNPAFLFEYGDGYLKNYGKRAHNMYPMGDYKKANIPAAIGSDSPVTDFNPMQGIHSSLTRITESGKVIGEDKTISLLQAIKMYTFNGAYASFEEDRKGSIEPGKLADLVLLDRSVLSSEIDELPEVEVEWTMVGGEKIYTRSRKETQV